MSAEKNIFIFDNTINVIERSKRLQDSIQNTINNSFIVLEEQEFNINNTNIFDTFIEITRERSFEAAKNLKMQGYENICVHNFASATNPGGGVTKGSSAQEECLCRISTLYPCLNTKQNMNHFYFPHRKQNAIHNADCLYTPNITVIKSDTNNPKLLKESDWYNVNVITCAAPNLRINPNNMWNKNESRQAVSLTQKELYEIHRLRLQRIIDIAYQEKNECLVIGAFGCGAFKNDPNIVARAMKDTILDNMGKFKKIVIAVYCSPRDEQNYNIFKRIFSNV